MSQASPTLTAVPSDRFRPTRRRWVPKGVLLLACLLVVGLFTAP